MSQSSSKRRKAGPQKRRSRLPILLMFGGLAIVAIVIAGSLFFKPGQGGNNSGSGTPSIAISDIKSSPEAQIDGLNVDFGDMKLGAELASLTMTISNNGKNTLSFTKEPYIQLADGC